MTCWICGHRIYRKPLVRVEDADGVYNLHFRCHANGQAVRLNPTPPAQWAKDAYNPTAKVTVVLPPLR